jgi:hypothetical protein
MSAFGVNSGHALLIMSISPFDPERTQASASMATSTPAMSAPKRAIDSAWLRPGEELRVSLDADVGRKGSLRKYLARIAAQRNERSFSGRYHGSFESIRTNKMRHG